MLKQKGSLPLPLYELKFSKMITRLLFIIKRIEQILLLIPFFYPKKKKCVFSSKYHQIILSILCCQVWVMRKNGKSFYNFLIRRFYT